jgi:hypothetical protein
MGPRDPKVEVLRERFEVHIRRVHVAVELEPRRGANVAGCDRHRPDALLATRLRDIDGILVKDDRIVVGEGDARTAQRLRGQGDGLGWQNLQARLHPAVPKERVGVPGR